MKEAKEFNAIEVDEFNELAASCSSRRLPITKAR